MHYVTYILLLAGFQLLCDPLRIEAYSPQVPFNDNSISTSKSVQEAYAMFVLDLYKLLTSDRLKTSGIIPDGRYFYLNISLLLFAFAYEVFGVSQLSIVYWPQIWLPALETVVKIPEFMSLLTDRNYYQSLMILNPPSF